MSLSRNFVLAATALLVFGLSVSASAYVCDHSEGYLEGNLATGTGLACNAVVDFTGGIYTYTYTLIYSAGMINPVSGLAPQIHLFDVDNPNGCRFFGAAADGFTPLATEGNGTVDWINGTINVGETRTFSYQSYSAPMEIYVYTYVENGGTYAEGETLGMGSMIPEPSSLAAILLGAAGMLPLAIRRRK